MHFRFQLGEARGEIHLVRVTGETAAADPSTEMRMACKADCCCHPMCCSVGHDMLSTGKRALGAKQRTFLPCTRPGFSYPKIMT